MSIVFVLLGAFMLLFIVAPPLKTVFSSSPGTLWNTLLEEDVYSSILLTFSAALPSSEFVARFALTRNILSGRVIEIEDGCTLIDIGGTKLRAATEAKGAVRLSLRPEDILISKEPLRSTARNCFPGVVSDIADRGSVIYITVNLPPDFVCVITRQALDELGLRKGVEVWITFKASAIHVF
jgi:molybdopterin-binding protein